VGLLVKTWMGLSGSASCSLRIKAEPTNPEAPVINMGDGLDNVEV